MSRSTPHDRFRHRLSEYVLESLASAERAELDAHLRNCTECQSHLRFVEMLRDRLAEVGEELLGAHPRAEDLVAYATEPNALETSTLREIGLHLQGCAACADATESTRQVERSFTAPRLRARLQPWIWAGSGAAAAALVLVALLPLSSDAPDRYNPDLAQPSLVVMPAITRTAAESTVVPRDTPLLLRIPVDPWNTRTEPGDFTLTALLLDEQGRELWRTELSAASAYDVDANAVHVLVPELPGDSGALGFVLRDGSTVLYERGLDSAAP